MKVSHDLVLNFLYTCLSTTQQKKLIFITYITTDFIRFQIISIIFNLSKLQLLGEIKFGLIKKMKKNLCILQFCFSKEEDIDKHLDEMIVITLHEFRKLTN